MKQELKRLARDDSRLEMTPMIDVTFLLLIFFMCTLKFKTLEGKLAAYLPQGIGVNQPPEEPVPKIALTLSVVEPGQRYRVGAGEQASWSPESGGRFAYGPDRVILYSVGPRESTRLSDLRPHLETLHRQDPERPVTIDAGAGVVYSEVVGVLDLALDAGFSEVTFVGAHEPPR
jgi:biopolymer transport protein ExbD